jgi:hypothetical protein
MKEGERKDMGIHPDLLITIGFDLFVFKALFPLLVHFPVGTPA